MSWMVLFSFFFLLFFSPSHSRFVSEICTYWSSASSSGPVEMGFRYLTFSNFFLKARHRIELKMVFPTPVFAP